MFAILEAARELKTQERADFMYELVGIAAVPGACSTKYVDGLENRYKIISENAVPELIPKDKKNGGQVEWKHATSIMDAAMKLKLRLEAHG